MEIYHIEIGLSLLCLGVLVVMPLVLRGRSLGERLVITVGVASMVATVNTLFARDMSGAGSCLLAAAAAFGLLAVTETLRRQKD